MAFFGLFGPSEKGMRRKVDRMIQERDVPGLIKSLECPFRSVRNSAIAALGTRGESRAVEPIINNLWLNACHVNLNTVAAEALGRIGDRRAVAPLINATLLLLEEIQRGSSRAEEIAVSIAALGAIGNVDATPLLLSLLKNDGLRADIRGAAAESLGQIDEGVELLSDALMDSSKLTRHYAAVALKIIRRLPANPISLATFHMETENWGAVTALGAHAVNTLIDTIRSQSWSEQDSPAIKALQEIRDPLAAELLLEALRDSDSRVRIAAAKALGTLRDARAVTRLLEILENTRDGRSGSYMEFRVSAEALGDIGDPLAVEPLIGYFRCEGPGEGRCGEVAKALGKLGDDRAVEPLLDVIRNPDGCGSLVLDEARNALVKMGHADALKNIDARRACEEQRERQHEKARRDALRSIDEIPTAALTKEIQELAAMFQLEQWRNEQCDDENRHSWKDPKELALRELAKRYRISENGWNRLTALIKTMD